MKKILLVVDNEDSKWVKSLSTYPKGSNVQLLTFNISDQYLIQKYSYLIDLCGLNVACLDTLSETNKIEKEVREFYTKLISDLPRYNFEKNTSINNILKFKNRNFWWFLLISEKNIWISKTVNRLYHIARLDYVFKNCSFDEVNYFINDKILLNLLLIGKSKSNYSRAKYIVLKFFKYVIIFFSYYINCLKISISTLIKFLILLPFRRKEDNSVKKESIGFFSFYPLWWKNPYSDNPKEIFFQTLLDTIKKQYNVIHLIAINPWRSVLKKKKYLKKFSKSQKTIFIDNLISFRNLFKVYRLSFPLSFIKVISCISKKINPIKFKNLDVTELIVDELISSFKSPVTLQAFLLDCAIGKLKMENFSHIFFRLEFQPIEKSLLYNTKNKTKAIGFQHSALSKNFLNYLFLKDDLADNFKISNELQWMPTPDYIITSGKLGYEMIQDGGYPSQKLSICGGLRYWTLLSEKKKIPSINNLKKLYKFDKNKKTIFFPATPLISETINIINTLIGAIKNNKAHSYILIIKHHPNAKNNREYIELVNRVISKAKLFIVEYWDSVEFHHLIKMSNCIITSGGSAPFEAMVLDTPSIIFLNDKQFSHNPMKSYPKAALFVWDQESLCKALNSIDNHKQINLVKENWHAPLFDMFGNLTINPADKILKSLEKRLFG